MFENVKEIIAEYKGIDISEIKMETTFEELDLDSLDMVELVMQLEEKFDTSIEMNEGIKSVKDVVELLDK